MFEFNKIGLGYHNVVLQHNKGIVKSRSECDISVKIGNKTLACPVIMSNMEMLQATNPQILQKFNERKWGYVYHRLGGMNEDERCQDIYSFLYNANRDNWHFKSISIGVCPEHFRLLEKIKETGLKLDCLTIDLAFVYTNDNLKYVEKVRRMLPDVFLIAGNFTSPWAALELERIGVDCGKFGIGTSAKCRTYQRVGIGTAIISDLVDCKEKTSRLKYMVDGGLTIMEDNEVCVGDCSKALNFGANLVMSASLFQRIVELSDDNGNIHCYGNSTATAKKSHKNDEGAEFFIKTNGKTLDKTMDLIEDSLKSFCSYAGISKISDAYQSCDYKIVI